MNTNEDSDEEYIPHETQEKIFYNQVWGVLSQQKDPRVIQYFAITMNHLLHEYRENGGFYPTVEFVLMMAQDRVKEMDGEENKLVKVRKVVVVDEDEEVVDDSEDDEKTVAETVRESWLKKYSTK